MDTKLRGSILLVAGCSIGAGMLGIPVVTGAAGFIPTVILFVITWLFMALSGIVLAELVLSYKETGVNLLSLAKSSLGNFGVWTASITFMFLFYAIMTAYTIATSILLHQFFGIPQLLASCLFIAIMFLIIAKGLRQVDSVNRFLMLGLIICYALLISFGIPSIDAQRLKRFDFLASFISLPILVVSFGYHNLVPSLASYLDRSRKNLIKAIVIGSIIPLFVYLIWEFVILGIIPMESIYAWKKAEKGGEMITQVLVQHMQDAPVVEISQGFAFFAIGTSFLPVAFSFLDFFKDGFCKNKGNLFTIACVLIPPLFAALVEPTLFLDALDFAGGICAVILFGILPSIMAYRRKKIIGAAHFVVAKPLVLVFLISGSLFILSIEILHICGVIS